MRRILLATLLICLSLPLQRAGAQGGAPIGAPVRFTPRDGTLLALDGPGALRGTIEVRRSGAALTVVNELDLDHYVMGVREVPGGWPMEALKAQAVAARTYALWELEKGYWKRFGFDVCATVSCQVYQGAAAEEGERGRRWRAAVEATKGEVLLDSAGRPALTRYHSTSGGRTLPNELPFPDDGPRPYLVGVEDEPDKVSPMHTWTVRFERAHLERILRVGIELKGTLVDIRSNQGTRKLTIETEGGELVIPTSRFRSVVSEHAPRLYPAIYPGRRNDGERLPFAMPSSRFDVTKTDNGFVLQGRGYGHGVGMSQYGAMGRATRGDSYTEILGAYYGGLSPVAWTGQRTIRVAVKRDAESARVSGDGTFGVTTNGQTLAASTLGSWTFAPSGIRSMAVSPPEGHALPLALTGVRVPDSVEIDPPKTPATLDIGFVVPKPAEVVGVLSLDGEEVTRRKIVVEAGEHVLALRPQLDRLARGSASYDVSLEVFDGSDRIDHAADVVLVRPRSGLWWKVLLVLLVVGAVVLRRRQVVLRRAARRRAMSASASDVPTAAPQGSPGSPKRGP